MGEILKFVGNNPLVSTVVRTLIATAILASVRPTRAAFGRFFRWSLHIVTNVTRRLRDRVWKALVVEVPAAIGSGISIQERDELKAELEAWKREALDARQFMKYGEPLPEFTALPDVRHEDVVTRVSELGPTTGLMLRYVEQVWQALRPPYKEGDPDSAVRDVIGFLNEKARYPLENTARALNEYVQARRDPRAFLVCFYRRYREWREWILKLGGYLGVDVRTLPNYLEWRRHDDEWRKELIQKVASPNLSQVRSALHEYNQEHGDMVALPEPDPPYTGPTQKGPGLRLR